MPPSLDATIGREGKGTYNKGGKRARTMARNGFGKMGKRETDTDVVTKEDVKNELMMDRGYTVVFYNDDVTTFDFVIFALIRNFELDADTAEKVTMTIHTQGKCNVGNYEFATALNKKYVTETMARNEGFPLKLEVEEIE